MTQDYTQANKVSSVNARIDMNLNEAIEIRRQSLVGNNCDEDQLKKAIDFIKNSAPLPITKRGKPKAYEKKPRFSPWSITEHQHKIMLKLIDGLSAEELADTLSVSKRTVPAILRSIRKKMGVSDKTSAHALILYDRWIQKLKDKNET